MFGVGVGGSFCIGDHAPPSSDKGSAANKILPGAAKGERTTRYFQVT